MLRQFFNVVVATGKNGIQYFKQLVENQHPDGYWLSPATKGIETDRNSMIDIDNKVYSTTLALYNLLYIIAIYLHQ